MFSFKIKKSKNYTKNKKKNNVFSKNKKKIKIYKKVIKKIIKNMIKKSLKKLLTVFSKNNVFSNGEINHFHEGNIRHSLTAHFALPSVELYEIFF